MGRINIEIEDEVHRKAKVISAMKGITLIEYVNEVIGDRLKKDFKVR